MHQLEFLPDALHAEGEYTVILQGDSVSIMCKDCNQAIGIGSHIFTQAFYDTNKRKQPFWLRGAIARWSNQYLPINTSPIKSKNMQIGTKHIHEDDFLAVLALEKAGFRGMRIVINKDLLECGGHSFQHHWDNYAKTIGYIVTLKECTYPHGSNYADVLWMTPNEKQYKHLHGIMATRFKNSTFTPAEFEQASWTRAVFDQVDSIVWGTK